MATSSTDSMLFWMVFCFVFFINIVTPFISAGFEESYTSHDTGTADNTSPPSFLSIVTLSGVNIFLIPFWTLTMPSLMNLFIMVPVRALMWYLAFRMIRGI